jgi:uncharacterized coiled-coil DUF342 family protein
MANFSLLAKLGADTSAYQKGIKGAETRTQKFRDGISGLGAAIAAVGFTALAKRAMDAGERITNLSRQLRTNAEDLQVLQYAADATGASQGALERALRNVQIRAQAAADGNTGYADALERLGLNVDEFNKLPTERKLEAIAKAAKGATNQNEAYADVARILGERAGPELAGVLDQLAKGYDDLEKEARKAGQVMSGPTAAAMEKASTQISQLRNRVTVLVASGLARLIPALNLVKLGWESLADALGLQGKTVVNTTKLIQNLFQTALRPTISSLMAVASAAKAAGLALSGNFKEAGEALSEAQQHAKDVGIGVRDAFGNAGDAIKQFGADMKTDMSDAFNSIADRGDEFDQSWDQMMNGIAEDTEKVTEGMENMAVGTEQATGAMYDLGEAAANTRNEVILTRQELIDLNETKLSDIQKEIDNTAAAATNAHTEIESIEQQIRDLNAQQLDDIAAEFGLTTEQMTEALKKAFRDAENSGLTVHQAFAQEVKRLDGDVSALGDRYTEAFDEKAKNAVDNVIDRVRILNAQTKIIEDRTPDIADQVRDLTKQLLEKREEARDLEMQAESLQDEWNDLAEATQELSNTVDDSAADVGSSFDDVSDSADTLSTNLAAKAEEIKNLEIEAPDFSDLGIDMQSVVDEIKESNRHLSSIDKTLQGKFVNQ